MCGIAGFYLRGEPSFNVDLFARRLLTNIDHRGGHATGYAAHTRSGQVIVQKASCDAASFLREARPIPLDAQSVILHTRFATQGSSYFSENNHPVIVGNVHVVHNGHIWNDMQVLRESGWTPRGKVDSEAIAAAIHANGWKRINNALETLDGTMAIAALNAANGHIVLARGNDSPLSVFITRNVIAWASTSMALEDAWKRTIGTPPKKSRYFFEGDTLQIRPGLRHDWGRFDRIKLPNRYSSATVTYSGKKYSIDSEGELVSLDGKTKLEKALEIMEQRKGTHLQEVATPSGVVSLESELDSIEEGEDPWIKCASCYDWMQVSDAEGVDELYCADCWSVWTDHFGDNQQRKALALPVESESTKLSKQDR